MSRDEVMQLRDKGIVTDEELMIKLNFSDYVRRFERENMNIIEFGDALDYDKKIGIIKEQLTQYAIEMKPEEQNQLNTQQKELQRCMAERTYFLVL